MQLHPLIQKLRDHYLEFRRKDYRRMKADGSLEKFLETRAQSALDQMETLMAQGIYLEQAQEIALAEKISPLAVWRPWKSLPYQEAEPAAT